MGMEMNLDTVIKGRRSIRHYRNMDVPDAVIHELIDLARFAPSSMNGQPWSFIIVKDPLTRDRLATIKDEYCPPEKRDYKASMLSDAPVVIVVCVDRQRAHNRVIENAVLATSYLMLAAYSRGLGSVYMSAYTMDEPRLADQIRDLLEIPAHIEPVTLLPLGYPDETPGNKLQGSLEGMIFNEKYGES